MISERNSLPVCVGRKKPVQMRVEVEIGGVPIGSVPMFERWTSYRHYFVDGVCENCGTTLNAAGVMGTVLGILANIRDEANDALTVDHVDGSLFYIVEQAERAIAALCVGDEIERLTAQRSLAISALEVDSEWSAEQLLDAISEALLILRPADATPLPTSGRGQS